MKPCCWKVEQNVRFHEQKVRETAHTIVMYVEQDVNPSLVEAEKIKLAKFKDGQAEARRGKVEHMREHA